MAGPGVSAATPSAAAAGWAGPEPSPAQRAGLVEREQVLADHASALRQRLGRRQRGEDPACAIAPAEISGRAAERDEEPSREDVVRERVLAAREDAHRG